MQGTAKNTPTQPEKRDTETIGKQEVDEQRTRKRGEIVQVIMQSSKLDVKAFPFTEDEESINVTTRKMTKLIGKQEADERGT